MSENGLPVFIVWAGGGFRFCVLARGSVPLRTVCQAQKQLEEHFLGWKLDVEVCVTVLVGVFVCALTEPMSALNLDCHLCACAFKNYVSGRHSTGGALCGLEVWLGCGAVVVRFPKHPAVTGKGRVLSKFSSNWETSVLGLVHRWS